jgi:hypothetical protein
MYSLYKNEYRIFKPVEIKKSDFFFTQSTKRRVDQILWELVPVGGGRSCGKSWEGKYRATVEYICM